MTTPCPHAGGGILICDRCVQLMVEPPKSTQKPAGGATPAGPKRKRPRAWVATLPDGKTYTFERVGLGTARKALGKMLKRNRAPRGTRWEPKE